MKLSEFLSTAASTVVVACLWATAPAHAASVEVLHNFSAATDGEWPVGGVVLDPAGVLYGSTSTAGEAEMGTLFRFSRQGFQVLHHFGASGDGRNPYGDLQLGRTGVLYGTTFNGGAHDFGSVFSYTAHSGYRQLLSFEGGASGAQAASGVTEGPDGSVYGSTMYQGDSRCHCGTLFRYQPASGAFTTLHRFQGLDGANPNATPTLSESELIGTTRYGGNSRTGLRGRGSMYSLQITGEDFTSHTLLRGSDPRAGLTLDGFGVAWGAAGSGGPEGGGGVFRIDAAGRWTWVHGFTGGRNAGGAYPSSTLLLASDGKLYGTTNVGGTYPCFCGSVFSVDPQTLEFVIVHGFTADEGGAPTGALAQDTIGRIYGVTSRLGKFGGGTIYRLTP